MPSSDRAPTWARPLLAAHLVATSERHYLRRLDDDAFVRTARACDRFILWTTIPGLAVAFLLLPSAAGLYALILVSLWGIVLIVTLGRRVASERRRRLSSVR